MGYINNIETPQGSQYDIHSVGIPSGEVDSTSTSTVFTATIPGITELTEGVCVFLRNGVVTSASGFTLNINGLGAKPCYSNLATGNEETPTAATRDTTIFNINYTMLFVYTELVYGVTGGAWICYRGYDANTNTIGYQIRTNNSTRPVSGATYRYRLLFSAADDKKWVPSNTGSSTNATASRTVNQTPINPFGEIIYYSSTSAVSANSNISATAIWQQYTLTLGYSFNRTGKALTLTYPGPVYIKCSPQTDGSAIMDSTTPYVQTLPSSDDGYIYIYLGRAYSAIAIELVLQHPVFYHDGTGIRVWTGVRIPTKTSDLINDSGFITSADVPEGSVASTTTPKMDGTAAVGTESAFARGDHVHPTDTSRASTATFSTSANGLVPKPSSAATNSYLNSSGTWTTPPNTTYTTATTAANGLLSNQMYSLLENNAIGADESSIDGINAVNGYQIHLSLANLQGDDYILEDYATIPSATTATYGVVKPDGTAFHYLNGTGGWTAPPNTTYTTATTAANGLMSAADKKKLDACSTVDNNSTYSLTQDTGDRHALIWTSNGGTPSTFTIPDNNTTYQVLDEQDHYNLISSDGSTVGTWNKEFTDLWAYLNSNNEYLLANPDYAVLMLRNMYIMGRKISGGTLKICNNFDLGFYNQIAYFTSGGMTSQTTGYIDAVSMTDDQTMHLYRINLDISNMPSIGSTVTRTDIPNTTYSTFSTSSDGLVPHPSVASTTSLLNSSGTWTALPSSVSEFTNDAGYITGMTILSYGQSTFQDFLDAYQANKVVYARASSNANPASGDQTRLAFMAYVNNATTPSCVEFQYYRSVSSHTATQQGDQVFVYTLKNTGWTVTTREASVKVVAGSNMVSTYSNNTITLNPSLATTAAAGIVKPDGTTITVDSNGVISSNGGGGSTPLIGTTATLTPTQVKTALRAGTDICIEYHGAFDQVPVDFRFTNWNGATDDLSGAALDAVVSNTIVYYNDNYYLFDLTGIIASEGVTLNSWFLHNTNLGGGSGGFTYIAENTNFGSAKLGDVPTLTASGTNSIAQGSFSIASGDYSHAEGNESSAKGIAAHAEGYISTASGDYSHAEGYQTSASASVSHAEGFATAAAANYTHAEGENTYASSTAAHAEGYGTTASGAQSHAEGYYSLASTATAHAEGDNTTASGYASHAQGVGNIASSAQAFAGGYHSTASHSNSFVHGMNLKTSHSEQAVFGQFNADDSTAFLLVGRGSSDADADRRNAFAVHTDGRASAGANATASEDLVRLGQILDLQVNTVSGDVTCSNGSWCTPTSAQLNSTGLYLVSARVDFANASAGRRAIILTSSTAGTTGNLINHQCIDARAAVNGDRTTCSIVTILNVTNTNYKFYCRAWQNSGSTRTVTGSIRAVKLK